MPHIRKTFGVLTGALIAVAAALPVQAQELELPGNGAPPLLLPAVQAVKGAPRESLEIEIPSDNSKPDGVSVQWSGGQAQPGMRGLLLPADCPANAIFDCPD